MCQPRSFDSQGRFRTRCCKAGGVLLQRRGRSLEHLCSEEEEAVPDQRDDKV